jgi:hypothetical protein
MLTTAGIVICVLIMAAWVWAGIRKPAPPRYPIEESEQTHVTEAPSARRKYTTEEILLPGVDIRRKGAERHIEVSRWAVENNATPAALGNALIGRIRAELDGKQIEAPERNRLKG